LIRSSKLFAPVVVICIVIVIGIAGFMLIEDYSLLDAVYMTVITIATIGYEETRPLSNAGKIFNIFLILSSFATFAYGITRLSQYILDGGLNHYIKHRRLMHELDKLNDHVIICGFGRNGQQAAKTFRQHHLQYSVIDNNPAHFDEIEKKDGELLAIEGNAYDDDILKQAGIERARAMLITLPVDADNVYVVLTARSLNDKLLIVSRANDDTAISKLKKAGANHVIIPDKIGGTHMAGLITRPDIIEFIEYLTTENTNNNLGAIDLKNIDGNTKTIEHVIKDLALNVIGVRFPDGKYQTNPSLQTGITARAKIFVLGKQDAIDRLQQEFSK
jgi:voltage-gated potassium channel